jgi:hypothetical protein
VDILVTDFAVAVVEADDAGDGNSDGGVGIAGNVPVPKLAANAVVLAAVDAAAPNNLEDRFTITGVGAGGAGALLPATVLTCCGSTGCKTCARSVRALVKLESNFSA